MLEAPEPQLGPKLASPMCARRRETISVFRHILVIRSIVPIDSTVLKGGMLISMRGTGKTFAQSFGGQSSRNFISKPENVPRECGYLAEFWTQPPRRSLIFQLPAAAGHQLRTARRQEVQET